MDFDIQGSPRAEMNPSENGGVTQPGPADPILANTESDSAPAGAPRRPTENALGVIFWHNE